MSMRLFSPISCGLASLRHICPDYEHRIRYAHYAQSPFMDLKVWNMDFQYIIDISHCIQMYEILLLNSLKFGPMVQ